MASKARHEDIEFGVWRSQTLTIEYSLQVLEELRMAAEEGYQKIPHGGIETGALLLGEFDDGVVRITEWREIPCEHAHGPGFILTEADQVGIAMLLEQCRAAPELEGLIPVGWFHTHTRSRLFLSEEDIAIHNRLFPEPWQTAMVLSMAKDQPAQAAFFEREAGGALNGEAVTSPFAVKPNTAMMLRPRRGTAAPPKPVTPPLPAPAPPRREPRTSRVRRLGFEPQAEAYPPPPVPVMPAPQYPRTPPELLEEPPRASFRWRLLGVMALLLALVAAAVLTRPYWSRSDPETMALRVEEAQDQLVIRWDHGAAAVRHAERAVIQIVDGNQPRQIDLNGEDARLGTVTYARRSEDVQVRLSLYQNGKVSLQEFARFLGPPVSADPAPVAVPPKTLQELRDERDKLRVTLREEKARGQRLRESVRNLENLIRQEDRKASGGRSAAQ